MESIIKMSSEDPNKEQKKDLYNGATRLIDLRNFIKRDQENLLLSIGTLFVGILVSTYLHTFFSYLIFGIILLFFLIYAVRKNNLDIQGLHNNYGELVNVGDNIKINLRNEFYP